MNSDNADRPLFPPRMQPATSMGITDALSRVYEDIMMRHADPVKPFPLRQLPPELRDNIYDYALLDSMPFKLTPKDIKVPSDSDEPLEEDSDTAMPDIDRLDEALGLHPPTPPLTLHASVRHSANPNLLRASKATNTEYADRARRGMHLVLADQQDYSFQPFTLPAHVTHVRTLELHLLLFCHRCPHASHTSDATCHAALELRSHQAWIENVIAQLPHLRRVDVEAHICHDTFKVGAKEKPPCEGIVVKKVAEMVGVWPKVLKRFVLFRMDFVVQQSLEGPKEVVWEWEDGVVKEVMVVENGEGEGEEKKKGFGMECVERVSEASLVADGA